MAILSIGELLDLGNSASTAGLIPYSALEYNGSGDISAISGSALAAGVDSAAVSSIASSYVESGVSSKVDYSAISGSSGLVTSINGSGISAQPIPTLPLYVSSPLVAGVDELSSRVTISYPGVLVKVVSASSEATASDVVYVVTGS